MRRLLASLLTTFVLVGCNRIIEDSPAAVVTKLYRTIAEKQITGAPNPEQLSAISPYISVDLADLLRRARQLHDAEVKRSPDEKPSFAEGSLFSSLFEGPTSTRVTGGRNEGNGTFFIPISMAYSDGRSPEVKWTDNAVVIRQNDKYVVSDIEHGGKWDFATKGSLAANLRSALTHSTVRE